MIELTFDDLLRIFLTMTMVFLSLFGRRALKARSTQGDVDVDARETHLNVFFIREFQQGDGNRVLDYAHSVLYLLRGA